MQECPDCRGVGTVIHAKGHDEPCWSCDGTGWIDENFRLHVFAPSGHPLKCAICGYLRGMHEDLLREVSLDKRSCRLFAQDYFCFADFDITSQALEAIQGDILKAIRRANIRGLLTKDEWGKSIPATVRSNWTINVGLYAGGKDVRAWPVRLQ